MVAESQQRPSDDRKQSFAEKRRGDFWVNALLGAVATFMIGVVPLVKVVAPVAGGAIAGYLQNTGALDGVKVGAVAGIIGSISLNFLAPPRLFGLFGGGIVDGFLLISILFAFVVWVITSAFGGAIGARVAEN